VGWPLRRYQSEQSLRYYAFHARYAVLQLPLLIVATRYQRRPRTVRLAADIAPGD
jgi:hypothetical protein